MATASYSKLKDGSWGVRVSGPAKAGEAVTVTKRSGEVKTETVDAVLWTDGKASLCSIAKTARQSTTSSRPSYGGNYSRRKACVTGGDCSSFGNGRSCGGYDCDGY